MISASIAAHINAMVHNQKQNQAVSASMTVKTWWQTLEAFASVVANSGDDDVRVRVLERASRVHGAPLGRFLPGRRQQAVLDSNPSSLAPVPAGDMFANLTVAAMQDVEERATSIVAKAERQLEDARQRIRELEDTSVNRSEVRVLRDQLEALRQSDLARKQENRALRQQIGMGALQPVSPEGDVELPADEPAPVEEPVKVRHKQRHSEHTGIFYCADRAGNVIGYGAAWPNPQVAGATKTKSPFDTLEEAIEYRRRQTAGPTPEPARPTGGGGASMADVYAGMAR